MALAFLVISAVYQNVRTLEWAIGRWDQSLLGKDPATDWERRVERIRDDLPQRGVVGYLSEPNFPSAPYALNNVHEERALTQYFLTPLILVEGDHFEWIVGNFGDPFFDDKLEDALGVEELYNYGWGIYLLRGKPE